MRVRTISITIAVELPRSFSERGLADRIGVAFERATGLPALVCTDDSGTPWLQFDAPDAHVLADHSTASGYVRGQVNHLVPGGYDLLPTNVKRRPEDRR